MSDQELIIRTEIDLKNHFVWHESEKIRLRELREKYPMSNYLSGEFETLTKEYDKQDVSFGEFGIAFGEIVMYYGHEGDVIRNVQYCPFCGIRFEVQTE